MRTVAKIDTKQIEDMDLDITFRMKVEEWRELMRQHSNSYPSWVVSKHISAVLGHLTKATEATITEPRDREAAQ